MSIGEETPKGNDEWLKEYYRRKGEASQNVNPK